MSKISVEISRALRDRLEKTAAKEGVSMSKFVAAAAAEKIAALDDKSYFEERAKRGSRKKLLRVLGKAPDVEPEARDKL